MQAPAPWRAMASRYRCFVRRLNDFTGGDCSHANHIAFSETCKETGTGCLPAANNGEKKPPAHAHAEGTHHLLAILYHRREHRSIRSGSRVRFIFGVSVPMVQESGPCTRRSASSTRNPLMPRVQLLAQQIALPQLEVTVPRLGEQVGLGISVLECPRLNRRRPASPGGSNGKGSSSTLWDDLFLNLKVDGKGGI